MGAKTDYAGHERRYRELRRSGANGWDSGQEPLHLPTRYIGDRDALLREIEDAGLAIVTHELVPRGSRDDRDLLLVVAHHRG